MGNPVAMFGLGMCYQDDDIQCIVGLIFENKEKRYPYNILYEEDTPLDKIENISCSIDGAISELSDALDEMYLKIT